MNFYEIIFLFFAFQAFILAVLFFLKKKGDRIANILLGIYVLLFGYNVLYNVLYWSQELFSNRFVHLVYTNQLIWVLYGPVLYLYIKRVIKKSNFRFIDILHFLPLLFLLINSLPFYLLYKEDKLKILISGHTNNLIYFPIQLKIKIIIGLMILYFGLIFFLFKNDLKSYNKSRWLSWLTFSFLGYVVSFASYFILRYFGFIEIGYDYFIGYTMIFFIGLLSYFGFLQPDIFNGLSMDKVIPFKKYQKTGLTKNHSLELKFRLINFMDKDKPYLDSELRLDNLANRLNLSRHHMSQIINEHFDQNFFDFINKYRIEESKKVLSNEDNLSITDVLYSCGFNNRVSFYKAFKKFTGITPTQYRSHEDKAC